MLICLGWQGYLESYLPKIVKILDFKPLELAGQLQTQIIKEQEAIGPYDMMFYAQMAKDLMGNVFKQKDEEIVRKEINLGSEAAERKGEEERKQAEEQKQKEEEEKKEEKKEEPKKKMTVAQMQAAAMKMAASKKKAAKGGAGAKGGKGAAKAPPKQEPAKEEKKAEPKQEEPEAPILEKGAQKALDTSTVINFCDQVRQVKAEHCATVFEILRIVNQSKDSNVLNYQDKTLDYVIMPCIRLLNYTATRFCTYFFLENLFKDNRDTPFYSIRVNLMSCILQVQADKIMQRTVGDFQKLFEHLREQAEFADMDSGYL